jgi:hypothetical protein
MTGKAPTTQTAENPWNERRVRLCAQFEEACGKGERPKLEDFLRDLEGPERLQLFHNLLRREVEIRSCNGENPKLEEYEKRFPDGLEIVRAVFHVVANATPEWIDRFKVVRTLGGGGFGHVYLCFDETLERNVAVKVPRPDC